MSPKLVQMIGSTLIKFIMQKSKNIQHDMKVGKTDRTAEKIATMENMMVRLEKKIQENRVNVDHVRSFLYWSWGVNFVMLLIILLRVFGIL